MLQCRGQGCSGVFLGSKASVGSNGRRGESLCGTGSPGHHPTTAPQPPTHLLRKMIWNSGLCRLVTDTYGSSNSCSFRTTAGNTSSAAALGSRSP